MEIDRPPSSGAAWPVKIVYGFAGGIADGSATAGGVMLAHGTLYGVTTSGGKGADVCNGGCGIAYRLKPPSSPHGKWTEQILYQFTGVNGDGKSPNNTLIMDPSGALYGTTSAASNDDADGGGTVFKLTPTANASRPWNETILYHFSAAAGDGYGPTGPLVLASDGSIYGATFYGGSCKSGRIYHLTPPVTSGDAWSEETIYDIGVGTGGCDYGLGDLSSAGVTLGPDGLLYGATFYGGPQGGGAIFKLDPVSKAYQVVWGFGASGDGGVPTVAPTVTQDGTIYGTTSGGGGAKCQCGTLFKLVPQQGGGYAETILHSFTGGADGSDPRTTVYVAPDRSIFGGTNGGGANGWGTAYHYVP